MCIHAWRRVAIIIINTREEKKKRRSPLAGLLLWVWHTQATSNIIHQ